MYWSCLLSTAKSNASWHGVLLHGFSSSAQEADTEISVSSSLVYREEFQDSPIATTSHRHPRKCKEAQTVHSSMSLPGQVHF